MDHVNVASMYEFFVDAKEGVLYLVLELLKGGELLDAVCVNGSYSEADAKHIMRQLFSAVAYLHRKNICHRDLKLDNLLLPSEDDRTTIKLIDFGLSLRTTEEDLSTLCGTPVYVAPELAQAVLTARRRRKQGLAPLTYTKAVDMWACGVIMYLLLSGDVPFEGEDEIGRLKKRQQLSNKEFKAIVKGQMLQQIIMQQQQMMMAQGGMPGMPGMM